MATPMRTTLATGDHEAVKSCTATPVDIIDLTGIEQTPSPNGNENSGQTAPNQNVVPTDGPHMTPMKSTKTTCKSEPIMGRDHGRTGTNVPEGATVKIQSMQ